MKINHDFSWLWLLNYDMLSLKADVLVPPWKPLPKREGSGSGVGSESVIQCTDPSIRIRIKMSRIRNSVVFSLFCSSFNTSSVPIVLFSLKFYSLLLIHADLTCVIEGLGDRICRQPQFWTSVDWWRRVAGDEGRAVLRVRASLQPGRGQASIPGHRHRHTSGEFLT